MPLHFGAVLLTLAALVASSTPAQAASSVNVLPLVINSVTVVNGGLVANGSLGSTTFQQPLTLTATPNPDPTACPILHLMIGPIHLSLLGLNVDTSAICLTITAQSGDGNLLGNLLCDIATALNAGTPLSTILAGLTAGQLSTLENGLTSLLNSVLTDATTVTSVQLTNGTILSLSNGVGATASANASSCNVLHLSLGPITLNLLGLIVQLDNCNGGPVTVDITATPGSLLGNIICDLANLLNVRHPNLTAIVKTLKEIAGTILTLI